MLVTWASRGIGRAIAAAFAGLGDRVAVHHRDSAPRAAAVVAGLPGSGHAAVQADLADSEAVRRAVDRVRHADQLPSEVKKAAARSAIMTAVAAGPRRMTSGMIETSTTRRPSTP